MNSHSRAFRILQNSKPMSLVDDAKPGPSPTLFPSHADDENNDDSDFSCISLLAVVDSPVSDELDHVFDLSENDGMCILIALMFVCLLSCISESL